MTRSALFITIALATVLALVPTVLVAQTPTPDARPQKIWNRTGPLGETSKRTTDVFPLSDQENKGGWVKSEFRQRASRMARKQSVRSGAV